MKQQITKNAIQESFLKLLRGKPFNKITVRDIVEDCGLTRNTFYYYYQDIYDIVDEIVRQEIEKALDSLNDGKTIEDVLISIVESSLENKKAIKNFIRSPNFDKFYKYLDRAGRVIIDRFVNERIGDIVISEEDDRLIRECYIYIFRGMLEKWLISDMEFDITADIKRASALFSGSVDSAVEVAKAKLK